MVTSGAYPLRRTPTQDRASRQVERILDAACAEVVERGYDAASTSGIAKRAEIAVGSVYRYFPDKRSLIQAIERRNQARYTEAVRERLASVTSWRAAVDVTLDTFREMHRTDPGFRAVVAQRPRRPRPGNQARRVRRPARRRVRRTPDRPLRRPQQLSSSAWRSRLSITMGESLAHLADRLPLDEAEYVLSQGRPVLYNLLSPHLPS